MVLGNISPRSCRATSKRMLAYSTIGQIGFMPLGPHAVGVVSSAVGRQCLQPVDTLLVGYVFTTLGTFGLMPTCRRRATRPSSRRLRRSANAAQPLVAARR